MVYKQQIELWMDLPQGLMQNFFFFGGGGDVNFDEILNVLREQILNTD